MSHNVVIFLVATAVYIATIPVAWKLLAQLVALTAARDHRGRTARFWALFFIYQLVIIAPYVILLLLGDGLSSLITNLLIGLIVLSVLLSVLRILGAKRTVNALWWLYGLVYDGLLYFYPYRHLKSLVLERVSRQQGITILDLGCGTGNVMVDVLERDPSAHITGVDISKTMLAKARRKLKRREAPKAQLVRSDVGSYLQTVPAGSVDQIIMLNVVYAVSDRDELWRECLRVLSKQGSIVATTSDRGGSKPIIKEHREHASVWALFHPSLLVVGLIDFFISEFAKTEVFRYLTADELKAEIAKAGGTMFEVERCYGGSVDGVNLLFNVAHA